MQDLLPAILGSIGGTVGFSLLLNTPRRTVIPGAIIATLGYLLYLFLLQTQVTSAIFAYFLSAFVGTILCQIAARLMRMPATVFLLSALIPLVPGYDLYSMMLAFVENDGAAAGLHGMAALQGVGAIAVGIAVSSMLLNAFFRSRKGKQKAA